MDKIKKLNLDSDQFQIDHLRPIPALVKTNTLYWNEIGMLNNLQWNYTLQINSDKLSQVKEIIQKACCTQVSDQEYKLIQDFLENDEYLLKNCGFTTQKLQLFQRYMIFQEYIFKMKKFQYNLYDIVKIFRDINLYYKFFGLQNNQIQSQLSISIHSHLLIISCQKFHIINHYFYQYKLSYNQIYLIIKISLYLFYAIIVPDLIENNANLVLFFLMKNVKSSDFQDYLDVFINIDVTPATIELIAMINYSMKIPPDFVTYYVYYCIQYCNNIKEKSTQTKIVKYVSIFIRHFLKTKAIVTKDLLTEVSCLQVQKLQAFCIEFTRVNEVSQLFKSVKAFNELGA